MKKSTILALFLTLPTLLLAKPVSQQSAFIDGFQNINGIYVFAGFLIFIFIHLAVFLMANDAKARKAEQLQHQHEMEMQEAILKQLPLDISFETEPETELEAIG